jgi:hypothetical protein
MNNKPHILLIDSHTKSNSGNYDLDLIIHPFILDLSTLVISQFSMVKVTFDVIVIFEYLRELFTFLTRNAIYDT